MEILWAKGPSTVRAIQENLPGRKRPAYTTVQTMVFRLEVKKVVTRTGKSSNAHIFEAVVTRNDARRRLMDEFLAMFGGMRPVMAHLVDTGMLTHDDLQEAERRLQELAKRGKQK